MNEYKNKEITKFSNLSNEWWDKEGSFRTLHNINHLRIEYINKILSSYLHIEDYTKKQENSNNSDNDTTTIKILDLGCGGGIFTEGIAKQNPKMHFTGIDPSEENIVVAKEHAKLNNINNITYNVSLGLDFLKKLDTDTPFDCICILEVIEHLEPDEISDVFFEINKTLCNGGILILSTINKTFFSYIKAILLAEKILKIVPNNTHQWSKFLKPSEIIEFTDNTELKLIDITGLNYSILHSCWELQKYKCNTNYFMSFQKQTVYV